MDNEEKVVHNEYDIPTANDTDHFAEISNVEYLPETNQTRFYMEDYYLNPDGSKVMKGGQEKYLDGEFTTETVVAEAQDKLIAPDWKVKVILE